MKSDFKYYFSIKGMEKIKAVCILLGMIIIIALQIYIILIDKRVEFFIDTKELYEIYKDMHCPACHGG